MLHDISNVDATWSEIIKATDESRTSTTTLANDADFFFPTVSGAVYLLDFMAIYGSPVGGATPDIKIAFGEDGTGTRGEINCFGVNTADAAAFAAIVTDQTTAVAWGTNAADRSANHWGFHRANGATFRILWAQNTNNGNATILRAGSYLRYRRLI